jgi:L-ascorbate metabolism protein UlaG (beta-lactamase superfamily)
VHRETRPRDDLLSERMGELLEDTATGKGSGMDLTKYGHACVQLTEGTTTIAIDPGALTPEPEACQGAEAVLITHEHFDHLDQGILEAALASRPDLRIFTCAGVAQKLEASERVREHVEVRTARRSPLVTLR